MTPNTLWTETAGKTAIAPEFLAGAKKEAQKAAATLSAALIFMEPKDGDAIFKAFMDVRGGTISPGGKLGVLGYLTPRTLGPAETELFHAISALCDKALNALMRRPLDATGEPLQSELEKIPKAAYAIFNDLAYSRDYINRAFPPQTNHVSR